ncbi:hypothetical protein [Tenacibaculum singaporense]|uniref:hypothetical protein n=1 Tax=Tenacibaculum singaporense TaxID=2358479 RepID=UPI000F66948E|nr:hypothetical protein [Tenacibaculum singaporense]RSC95908.1 hypothetical protein EI424_02000 [Tenacibaculum singaporense]
MKLNHIIKKIRIKYELGNSYSNLSCRFIIDVDFSKEFQLINEKEKNIAHKYLYNSSNSTGSQFVSFIYQRQHSNKVDFDEIREFIIHYEFAETLFEGVIRGNIIPNDKIKIESLEKEPLFNYTISYLNEIKYIKDDSHKNSSYKSVTGRSFDFDIHYHNIILEASKNYSINGNTISDIEICKKTQSSINDIRRLVINNNIPFKIKYKHLNTISNIEIDYLRLKDFIKNYKPSSTFEKVDTQGVLTLINRIEKSENESKRELQKLIKNTDINLNDIILVKKKGWDTNSEEIGIVKEFTISYDGSLEIIYNKIKINLEESKLPYGNTKIQNILYFMKQNDKPKLRECKSKSSQIKLIKKIGLNSK